MVDQLGNLEATSAVARPPAFTPHRTFGFPILRSLAPRRRVPPVLRRTAPGAHTQAQAVPLCQSGLFTSARCEESIFVRQSIRCSRICHRGASSIGSEFINDQIPLHQREARLCCALQNFGPIRPPDVELKFVCQTGGKDSVADEKLREGHGPRP